MPCCFRATGTINVSLLDNCEQLRPVSGCLAFFGQLASNLLGNWKAAALHLGNWHQWITFIEQLGTTTAAKRLPCIRATGIKPIGQLYGTTTTAAKRLPCFRATRLASTGSQLGNWKQLRLWSGWSLEQLRPLSSCLEIHHERPLYLKFFIFLVICRHTYW